MDESFDKAKVMMALVFIYVIKGKKHLMAHIIRIRREVVNDSDAQSLSLLRKTIR